MEKIDKMNNTNKNDMFNPPPFLRNAHVQSMLSSFKLRRPLVRFRARQMINRSQSILLDCGEGVKLHGYFSGHDEKKKALAILIHGWEGSADSLYLVSAASWLWKKGFDVFRLNLRDHGPTHHLNEKLFHSCRIDEVVTAVSQIMERFGRKRNFLGGFSLGGNFALRIAKKASKADIPIDRVVAVSPVIDPNKTLIALETGFFVYHKYFIKKWRRSLRKKKKYFPNLEGLERISDFSGLRDMTEYFVHHHTEFSSMDEYLAGYTIKKDITDGFKDLTMPCHIIASCDDPVIPAEDLSEINKSKNLDIILTSYGGHCGFIDSYRLYSWADRQMEKLFEV